MRDDPQSIWTTGYTTQYEAVNYGANLTGFVMRKSHRLVEEPFGPEISFDKVLEVGAGAGMHIQYVRHQFSEYWMSDGSAEMLQRATAANFSRDGVITSIEDATKLSFKNETFDRVIACHVLEHLYRPHEVLREWARVLKPGGTLSIVLPCDPGLAWRIGRHFGPRARAKKNGLDYDYTMAREHVNPINNLVYFLRYYFNDLSETWWPTGLSSSDLNLIFAANIKK
ncbi:class I SAM-dependent methyltransferase [Rhodopseudomonas sp. G2_2311]|uniref:class I SAM-dependent methyltransferase n=1 Tax=Rhodopseudomonas sp. G2_2311 TaxID=3114287 RepID=UPI0039C6883D